MQWVVWAIPTSNLIAAEATEDRALAIVRDLLATDWTPDELTLIVDDESLEIDDLPPAITGDELARRVALLDSPASRRTA